MKNLFYVTDRKLIDQIRKGSVLTEDFNEAYQDALDLDTDIYLFTCDDDMYQAIFTTANDNLHKQLICHIRLDCCNKLIISKKWRRCV